MSSLLGIVVEVIGYPSGDSVFELAFDLGNFSQPIGLKIFNLNLTANVIFDESGAPSELRGGLLTGYLPESVLEEIVNGMADQLSAGLTPETVLPLLKILLDIDTDGDGIPDSLSVGLQFETARTNITGSVED